LLPKVVANFSYTPNRQEMLEDVLFKNLSQNATNYDWDFGDNDISNLSDPVHQYPLGGDYKVTLIASNADGCPDTITKPIHIKNKALYWVPNAFTPRKTENMNDKFGLETPLQIHRFSMLIYNRWGEVIFRSNDVADRWDGTVNGEFVMSDVYSYIITFYDIDGYIFKYNGIVTLLD
jgi:gliding motility-associated-like protein